MKYNVYISIEVADDGDYMELKDEQVLIGSFDSLEDAKEFMDDTGQTMYRGEEL